MILTLRQYNSAKLKLEKWQKALEYLMENEIDQPDWLTEEQKFGILEQIRQLQEDCTCFEEML